jgi:hypothetical protein
MSKCEHCPREFVDSMDGLVLKTFHEILRHADIIHKEYDKDNIVSGMEWQISHPHKHRSGKLSGNILTYPNLVGEKL